MIRCALAWIQCSVGVSFPILNHANVPLPHIECKWITSIRTFLSAANMTIQVDTADIPPLQREGDAYIMNTVIQAVKFSPTDIRKINYCRLFLQVVTISDISMASGIALDLSKYGHHNPGN